MQPLERLIPACKRLKCNQAAEVEKVIKHKASYPNGGIKVKIQFVL
jgi:hypothetical protein